MIAQLALALALTSPSAPEVKELVHDATVDYHAGDFQAALDAFTRAYKLAPAPELEFDLGQCYRALHEWERAGFFYRNYLAERCQEKPCPEVQALLADVTARAHPVPPQPSVSTAPPPPPQPATTVLVMAPAEAPPPVHHPRRAFWWFGGSALVAGALWATAGGEVLSLRSSASSQPTPLTSGQSATISGWAVASDVAMTLTLALAVTAAFTW